MLWCRNKINVNRVNEISGSVSGEVFKIRNIMSDTYSVFSLGPWICRNELFIAQKTWGFPILSLPCVETWPYHTIISLVSHQLSTETYSSWVDVHTGGFFSKFHLSIPGYSSISVDFTQQRSSLVMLYEKISTFLKILAVGRWKPWNVRWNFLKRPCCVWWVAYCQ